MTTRTRATLIGSIALLLWATLALLTTISGKIPPFEMVAITFAVAALAALAKWLVMREPVLPKLRQPGAAWALGVYGLFGYHFLYFIALKQAPALEANLVNYLWPLLIVLFSALLPGERLLPRHIVGALSGLAGAALLVTNGQAVAFEARWLAGYAAALGCALVWSSYSVANRRFFAAVPTDAVGGFCAATSILALACSLAFEQWLWPSPTEWLVLVAMGLGPLGLGFFVWDHGVKHGDIRTLGLLSYASPLMSTGLLILAGQAAFTATAAAACVLIVGGALVGTGVVRLRKAQVAG